MIIRGPNPSEKRCTLSAYANVVILLMFHRLLETSLLVGENVHIVFVLCEDSFSMLGNIAGCFS